MMPAHITRLMTFAQHGQPAGYAASDMMRADLEALLLHASRVPRPPTLPIEPPLSLLPHLTDYSSVEHMSERDRAEILARLRKRWSAILTAIATPMGDCGNADCNWRGPLSECSRVGAVGPCCPVCREIVERDTAGVSGGQHQVTCRTDADGSSLDAIRNDTEKKE